MDPFEIITTTTIYHGDNQFYRGLGDDYAVAEETWEGSRLLNIKILRRFGSTENDKRRAEEYLQSLK